MDRNAPCCTPRSRRVRRVALLVLLALAVLVPLLSRAQAPEEDAPELVAEALFLADTLPPGGRDLNLSIAVARGEPDPVTGRSAFAASPRAQLAMALGPRAGFTADVGIATDGSMALDAPGASLKLLLRAPGADRTGLSASLDLFGSTRAFAETEAGLGLGAIRSLGNVALRATAAVASGVSSWGPHLHAGASAALALGNRVRALGEVVTEVAGGSATVSAGPTLKVALEDRTALMAGALFPVARPGAAPVFTVQLTQAM